MTGQIAGDMRAFGVRFGFIPTYEGILFLRIAEFMTEPGRVGLYHSKVIKDTDRVTGDTDGASTTRVQPQC